MRTFYIILALVAVGVLAYLAYFYGRVQGFQIAAYIMDRGSNTAINDTAADQPQTTMQPGASTIAGYFFGTDIDNYLNRQA